MKKKQLKHLNRLLNGSCRQLSPKILFHKHFGGPPIGATHSCKVLLLLFMISIGLFVIGTNTTINTSALTYSENVDVNFTFNPTISISLSYPDLIIEDLVPGSASDSNIITVTTSTNNVAGHILSASVGDGTTYTDTNLTNTTDIKNTDAFTSLATNSSVSGLNNINAGYWGYAYSADNGTNWSNYSGLPYYNTSPKELASTNTNGTSSLEFKIAANADNWQMAGEYNNVINFYAVTNSTPSAPGNCLSIATCMQTMTECPTTPTTVTDARDGSTYKVQRLADGNCWMLDNLALDLTNSDIQANMLSTVDTKTNATYEQLNYLFNGGGTTTDQWPTEKLNYQPWTSADQNYYSVPMIAVSGICANTSQCVNDPTEGQWNKNSVATSYGVGSGKIGIYYNYCAASAGTYCWGNGASAAGSPTTDPKLDTLVDIDGDVCPTNWRMPTSSDDGDYRTLCSVVKGSECTAGDGQTTSMTASSPSSMQYQLSTPISGDFHSGLARYQNYASAFWSSTWNDATNMYFLHVLPGRVQPSGYDSQRDGRLVRCLMSS